MRALTPFRYLIGDEDAVREIAASPGRALPIGLLFVASAAVAREYDGVYLVNEPEHLALPFVASVAAATLMFVMLWLALLRRGGPRPSFVTTYARWLALFLWTAPLAWVYAIPWERVFNPAGAAIVNLSSLGIVAVWRVVIMVRAGRQLLGASSAAVTAILLGVSSAVVQAGLVLNVLTSPLVMSMGGLRFPAGEALAANASFVLAYAGLFVCPVLLLVMLGVILARSSPWSPARFEAPATRSRGALGVAVVALLVDCGLLAVGQSEFAKAHEVETTFARGDEDGALRLLAERDVSDFPPHWLPPPARPLTRDQVDEFEHMLTLVERVHTDPEAPPWLRAKYVDLLCEWLDALQWAGDDGAAARRVRRIITRLPAVERRRIERVHWSVAHWLRDLEPERSDAAPVTS